MPGFSPYGYAFDTVVPIIVAAETRLFAGQPACEPCRVVRWMLRPRDGLAGSPGLERNGVGVLDLGYRHVDVFSRRALQGNGLVVVLAAENLSAAVMQDLTREVRQFETAFLAGVDLPGRSARLRIFTEDEELGFAGHPVLGAAAVLHTLLPAPDAEESWALTGGGSPSGPAARTGGWTRPWIRASRSSARR
jgi:Phenazine biosynthesis-like protein